ncbi:MAG: hypothetical protein ACRDRL_13420 [Sciscionella sp.]
MLQKREHRIMDFIKNHPYCSKDSLFTVGKIPKSRSTYNLIEKLIAERKIKMFHTKIGREIYTRDYSDRFRLLIHLIDDTAYELNDSARRVPKMKKLASSYSLFSELRTNILLYESRRAKKLNLLPDYTIIGKVSDFILQPTDTELKKLENYIEMEILRDKYYWSHERHAGENRRSIDDLMEIKKDRRYKIPLKKRDYEAHLRKIKNSHDISVRWRAEMGRSLYQNSDKAIKTIFRNGIKKRFETIESDHSISDHSISDNYEKERSMLLNMLDMIKKVPLVKITDSPKYGRVILKALLAERYEERMKNKYLPHEVSVFRDLEEDSVPKSLAAWDKFLSSRG